MSSTLSIPSILLTGPECSSTLIQEKVESKDNLVISSTGVIKPQFSVTDNDDEQAEKDEETYDGSESSSKDDSSKEDSWSSSTSLSADDTCPVVESYDELVTPAEVKAEIKISKFAEKLIQHSRRAIAEVISGKDDRLVVVVGPCSIHNVEAALHYAQELKAVESQFPNLILVMRTYFEKPRTTVGWKGLINDPELDGSFQIESGIRIARKLLAEITHLGIPVATELLDTISPQYLSDFISWGAIGARTTESQLHRELTSATPHPVGFKNGTDGGVKVAIDAMQSARASHSFMGVGPHGRASIVRSRGNKHVHAILRGGSSGTNFDAVSVAETRSSLIKMQPTFHPSLMIDCSHGNSSKDYRNQPKVIASICEQLSHGSDAGAISGVMIESNINEGRQDIPKEGPMGLKYGVSITDACVGFEETVLMLRDLEDAVLQRRTVLGSRRSNLDC
ncbi:hypothetical protein MJO28_007625 [Puccinia striiformis f. sp. tritici]|uniref:3-deoxy-7-phosphoheptulonate synthase n=3 Tax=Puccinia striiformis TaxID=27350 RepID=A0A0L0UYA3_9BASI|nr:hypothetical protein Pst134EA_013731 [Puccinia striiformis f. sp. tritici]KAI9604115.1 hypothetical protein H4Q26_003727 [Puccinia striiformis f. sp. tritici PST-130]KNE92018.1 3-deoxy-7-phosphoheptulonate synthase [Puccinia striiformis f. sp. tritici PST-78]KAH9454632.1 hypothetical protein Pst134EB_014698 [Puccinia striiformis f. sp. tritici]KAH9465870.1 hypothetical protein Pst134EA_013731 [Puccinia striiformis f. sp. tritici]KAI7951941.1 hypothetical protein MJO28_007625 [Puccinia strii